MSGGLDWTWLIDMLPSPPRVERDALGRVDYVEWTSRSGRSAVLAGDNQFTRRSSTASLNSVSLWTPTSRGKVPRRLHDDVECERSTR